MTEQEKQEFIRQAKEIATFGFEQGFMQAIELIKAITTEGKRQESRESAVIFAKTLEDILPSILKDVPEMFTFKVVVDEQNNHKIVYH